MYFQRFIKIDMLKDYFLNIKSHLQFKNEAFNQLFGRMDF